MIIDEHLQREAYLVQAVFARRRASAGLRPQKDRNEQSCQNGNNGDNHEQFDQTEGLSHVGGC